MIENLPIHYCVSVLPCSKIDRQEQANDWNCKRYGHKDGQYETPGFNLQHSKYLS